MNNNLSPLPAPATFYTGEYLDKLLNSPQNSSAMDIELKKINAHVVKEEALMSNMITSIGVTVLLLVLICLFYLPVIASTGVPVFPR